MSSRPIFVPVFEETETAIRERMLGRVSDEWRKEPGDFIHDAVAASPLEIKQLQINQDYILKNAFSQYAEDEYMDLALADAGLTREPATSNQRSLTVVGEPGVRIPKNYTLTTVVLDTDGNPLEYTTDVEVIFGVDTTTLALPLTCQTLGTIGNVATGSQFILRPPIPGVKSITDTGTTITARDQETDLEAWERLDFKRKNPDTGGNKNDYVHWIQDNVNGVGKALCIPRWNGNGTVKLIIVDDAYEPASGVLVGQTQDYIDPLAYQGLGYGKAPCGASVTVESATSKPIDITATLSYNVGADTAIVKAAFEAAVTAYLKSIGFETDPNTGNLYPVAYNKVGALLSTTPGVEDYSDLTLNAGGVNIPLIPYEVAILGTVTF